MKNASYFFSIAGGFRAATSLRKEETMLSDKDIKAIEEILSNGNKAEVILNKNGILVLEVIKRIKSGK